MQAYRYTFLWSSDPVLPFLQRLSVPAVSFCHSISQLLFMMLKDLFDVSACVVYSDTEEARRKWDDIWLFRIGAFKWCSNSRPCFMLRSSNTSERWPWRPNKLQRRCRMWMLLSFSLHDDVQMLRWDLSSGSEEDRSLVAVATCGREYGYRRVDLPRSGVLTSDALGINKCIQRL
jgi:hypothetical protein